MELEAMRYVVPEEIDEMMTALTSEERETIKAYMSKYDGMPPEKQGALGYTEALVGTSIFGFKSPYQEASRTAFFYPERRGLKRPFSFCGWAGAHNDLGPAYQINMEAFHGKNVKLFYTDDDIEAYPEEAEYLAGQIEKESSGISGVRTEKLGNFQVEEKHMGEKWGIVFTLSANAVKDRVSLNSRPATTDETGGYVFVLPKAGEFNCMLGHCQSGICCILSKDMYCMK